MKENQGRPDALYKYDFVIKIQNINYPSEKIGWEVKKFISNKIDANNEQNALYSLINKTVAKHLSFLGSNRFFLANYLEREGSLIVTFVLLITSYGSIRETIDYIVHDIQYLLTTTLPAEYSSQVSYTGGTHTTSHEQPLLRFYKPVMGFMLVILIFFGARLFTTT